MRIVLSVDLGTSNTAAVLRGSVDRVVPVVFDGAPVLPSAVCVDPSGRLLAGRDAWRAARSRPQCLEPNPKRRIDERVVLLGTHEVEVDRLIGAVLARVAAEVRHAGGDAPLAELTLTYPATWGARRRDVLTRAATSVGLPAPVLVPEPIAAAAYFVTSLGQDLPAGADLLVYDLGAGTFDASIIRRTADGYDVLGTGGLTDAGGLDVDAAIVSYIGAVYAGRDPAGWHRLTNPSTTADRRDRWQFWEDVRAAKEALSRTTSSVIHLPWLATEVPIGRTQLEQLAQPVLDRTVAATQAVLAESGVSIRQLAGVVMVGGASRLPLTATVLHRALGIAPTTVEQPELAVATGSLAIMRPATMEPTGQPLPIRTRAALPVRHDVPGSVAGAEQAVVPDPPPKRSTLPQAHRPPEPAQPGADRQAEPASARRWPPRSGRRGIALALGILALALLAIMIQMGKTLGSPPGRGSHHDAPRTATGPANAAGSVPTTSAAVGALTGTASSAPAKPASTTTAGRPVVPAKPPPGPVMPNPHVTNNGYAHCSGQVQVSLTAVNRGDTTPTPDVKVEVCAVKNVYGDGSVDYYPMLMTSGLDANGRWLANYTITVTFTMEFYGCDAPLLHSSTSTVSTTVGYFESRGDGALPSQSTTGFHARARITSADARGGSGHWTGGGQYLQSPCTKG
jgi:hypothetical protein